MFWSQLCKSNWNCAWNFAFPVFISPIVWNMCENLHYESVYFKELNNEQEYYWPTIYRAGAALVWTVITSCHSFLLLRWDCGLFLVCFQMRVRKNWTDVFFHFLYPSLLLFHLSSAFARLYVSTLRSTNDLSHQVEEKLPTFVLHENNW